MLELNDVIDMIQRGETMEEYQTRLTKLRKLCNERDFLEDKINLLKEDGITPAEQIRLERAVRRLAAVRKKISDLLA